VNLHKKSTSAEFERALVQGTPEDFDGYTEFYRLTPAHRLDWLCEAATFVFEFKATANSEAGLDTPYRGAKAKQSAVDRQLGC